jgi:hypothetical protein
MDSHSLTPEQAKPLSKALFPLLNYLLRLKTQIGPKPSSFTASVRSPYRRSSGITFAVAGWTSRLLLSDLDDEAG